MPQFLTHQGCAQPVGPVEQPAQGRLDAALALPRRQVQDLQILPGRLLRLLLPQAVVGHPEAARREQVVAVAVVGERPRLAHQPVDDVPVLDAVLAPAAQPRQPFDLLLRVPHLQVVGVDADLDPLADQPADHRVGVAADVDGAATIDAHRHSLAGVQTLRRQRPQHGCLLLEAPEPAPVALGEQRTHERRVVGAAGEVATAAQQQGQLLGQPRLPAGVELAEQPAQEGEVVAVAGEVAAAAEHQRLAQRPLELAVALLDVAVLVGAGRVDRLPGQAVVLQQRLVAALEDLGLGPRRHRRGQAVGAVDQGHAAQFPQGVLEPLAEALEALGKTDRSSLPIGVSEHEVVDQVRERRPRHRHAEVGAVGKVAGA